MVKNPAANAGNIRHVGSIPGSGRSPGEGHNTVEVCQSIQLLGLFTCLGLGLVSVLANLGVSYRRKAPWKESYDKPRQWIKKQMYSKTNTVL